MPRIIFHIDVNSAFLISRSYSPVLQQFSIDECFLDMTLRCAGQNPVAVATQLKDEIRKRLGFTVNVGVGSNKLLAKYICESIIAHLV